MGHRVNHVFRFGNGENRLDNAVVDAFNHSLVGPQGFIVLLGDAEAEDPERSGLVLLLKLVHLGLEDENLLTLRCRHGFDGSEFGLDLLKLGKELVPVVVDEGREALGRVLDEGPKGSELAGCHGNVHRITVIARGDNYSL